MNIGLVRHFKVKRGYPNNIISSKQLMQWVKEYDASEVEENEINLGEVRWSKCYSSDLLRAKITAQKTFNGEIIYLKELREIELSPLFQSNLKLPLFLHLLFIRLAWFLNHRSQPEQKREVIKRIRSVLDQILSEQEDVLIVSHGGIMMFMRKELKRRGFVGPRYGSRPENGRLYLFKKIT